MRSSTLGLSLLLLLACGAPPPPSPSSPSSASAPSSRCQVLPAEMVKERLALVVLGSGGPGGFGRAGSGYVVLLDGVPRILIDVGPGAFVRLGEMRIDLSAIDTVLLTHLHIDHSGDFPGFVKARDVSSDSPLTFRVVGPQAAEPYPSTTAFVERVFGKAGAWAYLPTFRNPLHFDVVDLAPSADVHEVLSDPKSDLRITSITVDHGDVPAAAFRVDHAGRSIVVTGDLASKNNNVTHLAASADVLVYDTAVLDPPASDPEAGKSILYALHTTPHRIGEVAAAAHVRHLMLSHLTPPVENSKEAVMRSVKTSFHGTTDFAEDCASVPLR